jgi:mannose-1-phosphate guanylyltransferase
MWTPGAMLGAFAGVDAQSHQILSEISKRLAAGDGQIGDLYSKLPKLSFDYMVTEKIDPSQVIIIKGMFGWSDIGSWDSVFDRMNKDLEGNAVRGKAMLMDTTGTLVYGQRNKLIAGIGLKDLIIVDTGEALLVCRKDQANKVRNLVQQLRDKNK